MKNRLKAKVLARSMFDLREMFERNAFNKMSSFSRHVNKFNVFVTV